MSQGEGHASTPRSKKRCACARSHGRHAVGAPHISIHPRASAIRREPVPFIRRRVDTPRIETVFCESGSAPTDTRPAARHHSSPPQRGNNHAAKLAALAALYKAPCVNLRVCFRFLLPHFSSRWNLQPLSSPRPVTHTFTLCSIVVVCGPTYLWGEPTHTSVRDACSTFQTVSMDEGCKEARLAGPGRAREVYVV